MELFLNFLTKLVENSPQLLILVLGTFLFVLSGASQVPISGVQISLSSPIKEGVSLVGVSLIGFAAWMLYNNEKMRRSRSIDNLLETQTRLSEELRSKNGEIEQKARRIEELECNINQALEIARDEGAVEIIHILSRVSQLITNSQEIFKPLRDAALWVNARSDNWVSMIEPSKYEDYGINRDNITKFREEILEHLRFLQSNLNEAIPDSIPRLNGVRQEVAINRLAYVKALQFIQDQMKRDLGKSTDLNSDSYKELLIYMGELIKKTTD